MCGVSGLEREITKLREARSLCMLKQRRVTRKQLNAHTHARVHSGTQHCDERQRHSAKA